ncbi:hypothetical protein [Amycolatopsis suaedae]|uniref:Uncharacterized protein n=1 Tax=Amycolatopsis suaedae TaxID=2510978 RepID=A0A4Q7JA02_9PSEU|nr:hypothetical protein [Amycolatopsis suaedae]RZQ64079.1 hypothetical protein EWH70_08765 [Amycolatopsis suaedae]
MIEQDPAYRRALARYTELVIAHREAVEHITASADKRAAESASLKERDEREQRELKAAVDRQLAEAKAQEKLGDADGQVKEEKSGWAKKPPADDEESFTFLEFDGPPVEQAAAPAASSPPPPAVAPPPPPPPAPRRRAARADDDDDDFDQHKWWAG